MSRWRLESARFVGTFNALPMLGDEFHDPRHPVWICQGHLLTLCFPQTPPPANQRGMSMKTRLALVVALAALWNAGASHAQGFKFSQEDNTAKAKEEARQQAIAERLSTPCMEQLKDKKIMLILSLIHI